MADRTQPHLVPREDTPPGALPVIGNSTIVRVRAGVLASCIIALIGLVVWLTALNSNVGWIMDTLKQLQADLRQVQSDLRDVKARP